MKIAVGRSGVAHRGRGQRPGERARRGAAQGARAGLSGGAARSSSSTTKCASSTGAKARAATTRVLIDSSDGARTLEHGRRLAEHPRGVVAGARRQHRVRAETRARTAAVAEGAQTWNATSFFCPATASGPRWSREGRAVLEAAARTFGHDFTFDEQLARRLRHRRDRHRAARRDARRRAARRRGAARRRRRAEVGRSVGEGAARAGSAGAAARRSASTPICGPCGSIRRSPTRRRSSPSGSTASICCSCAS